MEKKMHIIYKITYLPHLDTDFPKYYVGSKHNWKGNYFGSVASKQIFDYTNNLPLYKWWALQKKDKTNFSFEIIKQFEDITPQELVAEEKKIHNKLKILGSEYFNQSIATTGFASGPKSVETRNLMKQSSTNFWKSEAGQLKRQRLRERNIATKFKKYLIEFPDKSQHEVSNLKLFCDGNDLPKSANVNLPAYHKKHPNWNIRGYRLISIL
jgi:hypothetical protein